MSNARYDRRETGLLVHVLKHDALKSALQEKFGLPDTATPWPIAEIQRKDKGIYTVCTEGVGWFEEADGTLYIPMDGYHESFKDGGLYVDREFFFNIPVELVELRDFIRVFGDRLENNFDIWRSIVKEGLPCFCEACAP